MREIRDKRGGEGGLKLEKLKLEKLNLEDLKLEELKLGELELEGLELEELGGNRMREIRDKVGGEGGRGGGHWLL